MPTLSGSLTPSFGGTGGISSSGGATTIHHHYHTTVSPNITVQGNVTAEDDLRLRIVQDVSQGISEATTQLRRSLGVTS